MLGERLGLPVVVDNDATCAAWPSRARRRRAGTTTDCCSPSAPASAAASSSKGEVRRGANGFAGEPGHMVVDPAGPLCPCGRRGCWERFASGSGLGRLAREAAVAGRLAAAVELAGGETEAVRGEHVVAAGPGGDADAGPVLDEFAWWVALGVANLVDLLDPEIVVLGGGLAEAGDVLLDPVRAAVADAGAGRRPPARASRSWPAELGERAGAIGAALLAAAGLTAADGRRTVRSQLGQSPGSARARSGSRSTAAPAPSKPLVMANFGLEHLVDLEEVLDLVA